MIIIAITTNQFQIEFWKKFKIINEKFDDNDLINDDANLEFKSNVNISFLKRSSQGLWL